MYNAIIPLANRSGKISYGLRYESLQKTSLSIQSEESEEFPEDGFLSCYGPMAEHIEMNLSCADMINHRFYNKSKIHAITIDSEVDRTSLGVYIKHLVIYHVLPLCGKSVPAELTNTLQRRSIGGF